MNDLIDIDEIHLIEQNLTPLQIRAEIQRCDDKIAGTKDSKLRDFWEQRRRVYELSEGLPEYCELNGIEYSRLARLENDLISLKHKVSHLLKEKSERSAKRKDKHYIYK